MASDPLSQRVLRFARSLLVGGAATVVDFAVLEVLVRGLGADPTEAAGGAAVIGMGGMALGNNGPAASANASHGDELEAERESNRLLIETVHRLVRLLGGDPA